jgi:4-hydroxybenzoate polyprenyltransferase
MIRPTPQSPSSTGDRQTTNNNHNNHRPFKEHPQEVTTLKLKPYLSIARPDNWFKNMFMLPGVVFAIYDLPRLASWDLVLPLLTGFIAACLVASSNYTLNEILDAPEDALHPVKSSRPVPSGQVSVPVAYLQWIVLAVLGLGLSLAVSLPFFLSSLALWIMGLLYNIPPVRLKQIPYLDVLSESVNNPIRLLMGWYAVNTEYPPALSLVLAYWMIGAFFMAVKRYAEYRRIGDPQLAARYRKSFAYYNEYRLLLSIIYYAAAFALFFGIFMVRYRLELILSVPLIAGFISLYMKIGLLEDSPAQYPERLYQHRGLVLYVTLCVVGVLLLLFIDLPVIRQMFAPYHLPGE